MSDHDDPGPALPEGWEWADTLHAVEREEDGLVLGRVHVGPLAVGDAEVFVSADCASPEAVLAVLSRAGVPTEDAAHQENERFKIGIAKAICRLWEDDDPDHRCRDAVGLLGALLTDGPTAGEGGKDE